MKINFRNLLLFVFLFTFSLVPLLWFHGKGDLLINGVDTNFPLNPLVWFEKRFYVWYSITNAGADFSSSVSGVFFHFIQVIPYILGIKLQQVELLSFIFWFSLIIFSSFFLARLIFPKKIIPQVLFVVFYSFNIYLFNSWENVKVANLSLVSAIPLAISVFILLHRRSISFRFGIFLSCLVGIVVSGTGINPSYFIAFLLTILLFFVGNLVAGKDRKNMVISLLVIVGSILMVNLYWILPTFDFIFKNIPTQGGLDKIGFNNWLDSLSENTSIFNIMRLQGAWDWYPLNSSDGLPLYIPYATRYFYSLPFLAFSIIPASLSLISLIFRNKENKSLYLSFSIMLIIGIFLGVGTHLPTGSIFRFFLNHVPFFNLFRSPWYIFTPLVTLSYAGLISLLFYSLEDRFALKLKFVGFVISALGVVLIVGNLIYSYPLITGKIFRPASSDGFYVNFPDYVFDAAEWLSKTNQGRVIGYPDDEIEKFDWRYRGIESILQLVVDRDVLFLPLNAPDAPVSLLVKEFYRNLRRGRLDAMKSVAAKLNVGLIFYKGDQPSLSPPLPEGIKSLYNEKFGRWTFYGLSDDLTLPKIYSAKNLFYSYPYNKNAKILSVLAKDDHVINFDDEVVKSIRSISDYTGEAILARNLQLNDFVNFSSSDSKLSNRLVTHDLSKADYEFEILEDGFYEPRLERYYVESFGLPIAGKMEISLNNELDAWIINKVSDSYVFFEEKEFKKGNNMVSFKLENNNLVTGGDFEDGEKFKRGGRGEEIASYEIRESETGKFLSLYNLSKADQSADFSISGFNPFIPYYAEFRYQQIYGNNGQIVGEQSTSITLVKAQTERLPNYPEWQKFSFYYQPVETESEMKMFLVAPYTKDSLGTKIFYDDLVVKKVFTNNLFLIKRNKNVLVIPEIDFKKNSMVSYEGTAKGAGGPHIIVFSENYSPGWELRLTDLAGKSLIFTKKHLSINLYANAWFLENTPESYKFEIYYGPQKLFYLGTFVTVVFFVSSIVFLVRKMKR